MPGDGDIRHGRRQALLTYCWQLVELAQQLLGAHFPHHGTAGADEVVRDHVRLVGAEEHSRDLAVADARDLLEVRPSPESDSRGVEGHHVAPLRTPLDVALAPALVLALLAFPPIHRHGLSRCLRPKHFGLRDAALRPTDHELVPHRVVVEPVLEARARLEGRQLGLLVLVAQLPQREELRQQHRVQRVLGAELPRLPLARLSVKSVAALDELLCVRWRLAVHQDHALALPVLGRHVRIEHIARVHAGGLPKLVQQLVELLLRRLRKPTDHHHGGSVFEQPGSVELQLLLHRRLIVVLQLRRHHQLDGLERHPVGLRKALRPGKTVCSTARELCGAQGVGCARKSGRGLQGHRSLAAPTHSFTTFKVFNLDRQPIPRRRSCRDTGDLGATPRIQVQF
eukprot:scaffold2908_cov257-Pinguiococcus_pyrenoidosus.AAC.19